MIRITVTGDGKCAIDIVHNNSSAIFDYATFEDIRKAATRIMEHCVENRGDGGEGGFVGRIGM